MVWEQSIFLAVAFSFVIFQTLKSDFGTDLLGNFLSDDEYRNRTFCWTPACLYDAGSLIYDADHDSNQTNPCLNFKKFAMGEFLEHRVPSDRYPIIGFQWDIDLQYYEKQKRILHKKSKDGDPEVFNVIKSFFKKCSNTGP